MHVPPLANPDTSDVAPREGNDTPAGNTLEASGFWRAPVQIKELKDVDLVTLWGLLGMQDATLDTLPRRFAITATSHPTPDPQSKPLHQSLAEHLTPQHQTPRPKHDSWFPIAKLDTLLRRFAITPTVQGCLVHKKQPP